MNEKIYVIVETDFDQSEVLAATTNSGKAEFLRRHFELERGEWRGAVEIYEFNEHEFDGLIFHDHHHFAIFMRFDGTVGNITDWGNSRMGVEPGLKECISDKEKENGCVYRFDCYAENQEKAKALALNELQKYQNEKCGVRGGTHMEKKVYELKIDEKLARVMPPLQEPELGLLTASLLAEGCREPLVAWNGVIVDGHNRYRICRENQIPFTYVEMDFANQTEAILWMIKTQIGRRNLSPFQKCEMVLPIETELKAEAKRRQGWRSDMYGQKAVRIDTRDVLANMAGVSHATIEKVKFILNTADDETLRRVRKGEISIHFAYSSLVSKPSKSERMEPTVNLINSHGTPSLDLLPIGDAVRELLNRVVEGEATTKMIIAELENVVKMLDEIRR